MAKIMLATGMMVGYAYSTEFFIAWYSGVQYEAFAFLNRAFGPYAWAYWIMVTCNVLVPQLFWIKKLRTNVVMLFIASILVNVGMWFERFVIVVTSLSRDYLPAAWGYYTPTIVDVLTFVGSFGLFFTLFLLFVRFLPIVGMAEVKGVMPEAHPRRCVRRGTPSGTPTRPSWFTVSTRPWASSPPSCPSWSLSGAPPELRRGFCCSGGPTPSTTPS
jgi:Ni/Fe-hydrogenase subunit HybB-like protein